MSLQILKEDEGEISIKGLKVLKLKVRQKKQQWPKKKTRSIKKKCPPGKVLVPKEDGY